MDKTTSEVKWSNVKDRLFVTVIDQYGEILFEEFNICQVNTYKHGFELIQTDGNRIEFGNDLFPCKYSFNVAGSTVLIRIKN